MFIDTDKTIKDFKLEVHQDYLMPFMVIHDEVDYICDTFLMKPIMTKVARISEVIKVFDKIGYKFVRFVFDLEYDKYSSFTASNSFSQYEYQMKKFDNTKKVIVETKKEMSIDHGKSAIMQDNEKIEVEPEEDNTLYINETFDDDFYNNDDEIYPEVRDIYIKVDDDNIIEFLQKINELPDGEMTLFVIVNNEMWEYGRKLSPTIEDIKSKYGI